MFFVTFALLLLPFVSLAHGTIRNYTDFECPDRGRFIDEYDPECKRYFLCAQRKNGEWVKTIYYCPEFTNFDKELGACTSTALCQPTIPTLGPTTTEAVVTTEPSGTTNDTSGSNYTCVREGRFPDRTTCDCGWFFECRATETSHDFISWRLYCPPATKFDPELGTCSPDYECPEEFVCTKVGLFLDESAPNGDNYFNCTKLDDGTFYLTHHVCPANWVFVPTLMKCEELVGPNQEFQCEGPGRFADPSDDLCKWYYHCNETGSGERFSCPDHMHFDPKMRACSTSYECSQNASTETWLTNFKCSQRGYFYNKEDSACRTYHFCDIMGDGSIYQYDLFCPEGYIFDVERNVCGKGSNCQLGM